MAKLTSLLNQRFLKKEKSKMHALVEKREEGNLNSFSGIFGSSEPTDKEKAILKELLEKYSLHEGFDYEEDYSQLLSITCEVKAINNQAAILHGERIKHAQTILKRYRDGAFSAWLVATYGNRQTPYNFLQYYEFYNKMPRELHPLIETMPRQAVYTLASREGALSKKEDIVRSYSGETKQQMIALIRSSFPLDERDRRKGNVAESATSSLSKLVSTFEHRNVSLTHKQKRTLVELVDLLHSLIQVCPLKDRKS